MREAIREKLSIQILCKDDNTIVLKDVLQRMHQFEAVNLAVLLEYMQHLLPFVHVSSDKKTEEVDHLLSQRYASREDHKILV